MAARRDKRAKAYFRGLITNFLSREELQEQEREQPFQERGQPSAPQGRSSERELRLMERELKQG